MKHNPSLASVSVVLCLFLAATVYAHAGAAEDGKEGSGQVAEEIKEDAVKTGKAVVKTGKDIKEGSKKAWKDVKEGMKGAGRGFKKAYEETRDAIRDEVSGDKNRDRKTEASEK